MVTFIFVRHGQSVFNKTRQYTGQLDIPLDSVGLSQAKDVCKYITENYKIDAVVASDLSRAYGTVLPAAKHFGLDVIKTSALREINVGDWQGKYIDDLKKDFSEKLTEIKTHPDVCPFPNGETSADVLNRSLDMLKKSAKDFDGKTVLVGTHGGVVRVLMAYFNGVPISKLSEVPVVPNASVTVVRFDGEKFEVVLSGFCDYLSGEALKTDAY